MPGPDEHDEVGAQQVDLKKSAGHSQMNKMRSAHSGDHMPGPEEHEEVAAHQDMMSSAHSRRT